MAVLSIASGKEYLAEGRAEVWIEDGVDDRVEETVAVTEPHDDATAATYPDALASVIVWLDYVNGQFWLGIYTGLHYTT